MSEESIIRHTPIEVISEKPITVSGPYFDYVLKHEERACADPGPAFSKVRGLYAHLRRIRDGEGVRRVGYVESAISMAGWGVAWACRELGMEAVIFDPQHKKPHPVLVKHRTKWQEFGATVIPVRGGMMTKVNWYDAVKIIKQDMPDVRLLPIGISFPESVEETAKELQWTMDIFWNNGVSFDIQSIVVAVGSGTIISGIVRGLSLMNIPRDRLPAVFGVTTRQSNLCMLHEKINKLSKTCSGGFLSGPPFHLFNSGYEYTQPVRYWRDPPFPTSPWYDGKAYQWMIQHWDEIPKPVMFWNIGAQEAV